MLNPSAVRLPASPHAGGGLVGTGPCCHPPAARVMGSGPLLQAQAPRPLPGMAQIGILPWGDEDAQRPASSPCAAQGWWQGPSTESGTQRRAEIVTVKPLLQKD